MKLLQKKSNAVRLYNLILLFSISLLFSQNKLFAQQELSNEKIAQLKELAIKIDGTYQIQVIESRALPTYNLQLMEVIEANRSETDTVYYPINDYTRVMILPKNIIDNPSFIKIPTTTR